ncbi:MAG: hypothetical protein K0R59_190 [Sphingobacterium sp.]|jgi:thiol-disulfide isomerase/thioredoxin|nr:hypothetical protein [Sphingobacterium sp.]
MKKLFFCLLFIPFMAVAQKKGIYFEHNTSWEKVKTMAKAKNKHIFVDCFTTWCGPCKYMASTIFPQENVGVFFNTNFINLKLQMDQTVADNEEVKSWYAEAKRFEKDYAVAAYPTFLIFNPEGELVHRIIGGDRSGDAFIERAKLGLSPETQQAAVLKKFESTADDAGLARKVSIMALENSDDKLLKKSLDRYIMLVGVDSLFTTENLNLLLSRVASVTDPRFKIIMDHKAKVDQLLAGKGTSADDILGAALFAEKIAPLLETDQQIDFEKLQRSLQKEYPQVDMKSILLFAKAAYYKKQKNWPALKDVTNEGLASENRYFTSANALNSSAWAIFEGCDDVACIQAAVAWSKKSLEDGEIAAYMDTYANLLYKSGDKESAIQWQKKAVEKVDAAVKAAYQATLDNMLKGVPTWNVPKK